jgi:S1-C subfamily serine protease
LRAAEEEAARRAAAEEEARRAEEIARAQAAALKAAEKRAADEAAALKATAPRRPRLGVEVKMMDDPASGRKDCTATVHSVAPHGPADQAGIRAGDVVLKWNGNALTSKKRLQQMLEHTTPGMEVVLSIQRDSHPREVTIIAGVAGGTAQ